MNSHTSPGDLTGHRLDGRYELVEKLGEGAMGQVYRAHDHTRDGRTVAVKLLSDPATVDWFRSEFETVSLMVHPGIAQVFDFGHSSREGLDFYTTEYVNGVPVDGTVAALPFVTITDIGVSILKALDYIHGQGYLHCDVKPGNVLLQSPQDNASPATTKILDFGLATAIPQSRLTARGTLAYMAPEWFKGGIPGPHSDLYSAGVMFYQMTWGSLPFDASSAQECIRFHNEGTFPWPKSGAIPEWWIEILKQMVSRDPADRFSNAREVLTAVARGAGRDLEVVSEHGAHEGIIGGPWIGRQQILKRALAHVDLEDKTASTNSPVLVLEGASGTGKSRLLQELKRRLQLRGTPVAVVDPQRGEPLAELSTLLSLFFDQSEPRRAQERGSHIVSRLVNRTWEFSQQGGLVLLLDNLQSWDDLGRSFVQELINRLDYDRQHGDESPQLALVLACTPALQGKEPFTLPGDSPTEQLTPLSPADTQRLLSVILGTSRVPDELVREVHGATDGNPQLVVDTVVYLRQHNALTTTLHGIRFNPSQLPARALPSDLQEFFDRSWDALKDIPRHLLQLLAIAWEPLENPVLRALTSLESWELDHHLTTLADSGLIAFQEHKGRWRPLPATQLQRRLILEHTPEDRQRALHGDIAAIFQSKPPQDSNAPLLAYHNFKAGRLEQASQTALSGARQLINEHQFRRARQLVDIARDSHAAMGDVASLYAELHRLWGSYREGIVRLETLLSNDLEEATTLEIRLHMAELAFRDASYDDAIKEAEAAGTSPDRALVGRSLALIARSHFYLGNYDEARSVGERGMVEAEPESREMALCAVMVGLVRVYQGKLQQGLKYLETARPILDKAGSGSDAAFAANVLGLAHHKLKNYDQARIGYQDSLVIALEVGDNERINVARVNLSVLAQEQGRYGDAIVQYQEALQAAHQTHNLPILARVTNNLGTLHRYLGLMRRARDYANRSLDLALEQEQELLVGLNQMLLAEIHLFEGEYAASRTLLQSAKGCFQGLDAKDEALECDIDTIELLTEEGRLEEAAKFGREVLESAKAMEMDNHLLRATLSFAQASLATSKGTGTGAHTPHLDALEALKGSEPLLDKVGSPELAWRHRVLTASALEKGGDHSLLPAAMERARRCRETLEANIPKEFHTSFLARLDRRRFQDVFEDLQRRITHEAPTLLPGEERSGVAAQRQLSWMIRLIQINRRLVGEHDLERVLEAIIDQVVDLSGAERGFVLLRGTGSGLDVVVARNMDREAIRRSKGKFSTTIANNVLRTGETVRLADAVEAGDFRDQRSILAMRIRSVICLPLLARGEVIGALYLDNRFQAGVFDNPTVDMLKAFSEQAALAIENARLLHQYRGTVSELEETRKEVERLNSELQEKVQLQQALLEQQSNEIVRQQQVLTDRFQFKNIVGESRAVRSLFGIMDKVRETHVPVLITGESGVGKELVARALHFSGPRKQERFVSINCAALPDTLLESELFGYSKGAFTGAAGDKKGLFSLAHKGTLFLDELGDMSLSMQAKLLRVLQEGEVSPLGSEKVVKVDVRIIAATNQDLRKMVEQKTFRQDLYYRLDVVSIRVPALRERKEDVPLLLEHFLRHFAEKNDTPVLAVDPEALQLLLEYDWPGNIRELQSVVMTSAVFAEDARISLKSLESKPELRRGSGQSYAPLKSFGTLNLKTIEKQAVVGALRQCDGNKQQAAKVLGISRRALYNKLESHNIS